MQTDETIEQLEKRIEAEAKDVPTRVAITNAMNELLDAVAQNVMAYDPGEVSIARISETSIRLLTLNIHLGELFNRFVHEHQKPTVRSIQKGERFYWLRELPDGRWQAMVSVRGCDRSLDVCATEAEAFRVLEQRSQLTVIGGGK